jgi:hypothetical protein
LELFFALAQRNRGRKTTYFDAVQGTGKLKPRVDPAPASGAFFAELPCSRQGSRAAACIGSGLLIGRLPSGSAAWHLLILQR